MKFLLLLAILATFNLASIQGQDVVDCLTDQFCRALPCTDSLGVFSRCRESDKGNVESPKVCAFIFVTSAQYNLSATVMNPAPERCKDRMTPKAIAACNKFIQTHSPYNYYYKGKQGFSCYSNPQPFLCTVAGKSYITCSVTANPCKNPCGNPPN